LWTVAAECLNKIAYTAIKDSILRLSSRALGLCETRF
jgi:hypothetical protein